MIMHNRVPHTIPDYSPDAKIVSLHTADVRVPPHPYCILHRRHLTHEMTTEIQVAHHVLAWPRTLRPKTFGFTILMIAGRDKQATCFPTREPLASAMTAQFTQIMNSIKVVCLDIHMGSLISVFGRLVSLLIK